ncbi:acyl-CoA dehydrogenase family protein [Piscinibacter sakaiensis]|uniref:acyl-CoA dehydrogenase family protein n=1 Tax=Piscinibacter sakaiensis TaxID=1547922 RepID=UPI003AAE3B19
MNFEYTYEQTSLAESITRCIKDTLPTPSHRSRQFERTPEHAGTWQALAEIGAVGVLFDQEVGGYGEDLFDVVNVFEVFGRALLVDQPFLGTLMAGRVLAASTPHHDLLQAVIAGESVVTLAHCETDATWEPSYVTTRAERQGDAWVLDGVKAAVPNARDAKDFVVSARTAGAPEDKAGITMFLVPAVGKGVKVRSYPEIDGGRAAEVAFESVVLDDKAIIGAEGQAFRTLERGIAIGTLALCAQAVGAMDALINDTIEYLKVRKQFATPIGRNQAIQHRIVEMMIALEEARSSVINAAAQSDEAAFLKAAAAAKITTNASSRLIGEEAIQLHGGIGMTWELESAHYASWLSMVGVRLGDDDMHLERYLDPA